MNQRCVFKIVTAFGLFCLVQATSAAPRDSVWLYPTADSLGIDVQVRDTTSDSIVIHPMADTGETFQGKDSNYINYDYQFTQGWAGFKILWNEGAALTDLLPNFSFVDYDSLVFYYKGPLSNHTITVSFGSSTGCGEVALTLDSVGILPSSSTWARASLPLSDSLKQRLGVRQLNFILHDKAGVTNLTSSPGNLKIDNIVLIKVAPLQPPGVPELSLPANNATNQTIRLDLSWGSVSNSASYDAQVSLATDFHSTVFGQTGLTSTSVTLSGLAYATEYFWRVSAANTADTSMWSSTWDFTTASQKSSCCGCGSGTGLAILPPICFKALSNRKRKKKKHL